MINYHPHGTLGRTLVDRPRGRTYLASKYLTDRPRRCVLARSPVWSSAPFLSPSAMRVRRSRMNRWTSHFGGLMRRDVMRFSPGSSTANERPPTIENRNQLTPFSRVLFNLKGWYSVRTIGPFLWLVREPIGPPRVLRLHYPFF